MQYAASEATVDGHREAADAVSQENEAKRSEFTLEAGQNPTKPDRFSAPAS
jgi:hypothetical protein